MQKTKIVTYIAIILIILSCILFGLIFVVPFLKLSLAQKAIFTTVLVVGMEISWWVGVAIIGKQVIARYRKHLDPRTWFSPKNKKLQDRP